MKKLSAILLIVVLLATALSGCSKDTPSQPQADVDLSDIREAIEDAYGEDYFANTDMPVEMIEIEFGLTEDMYDEIIALSPMIGSHPDRVVLVKAADGKADDVESALKAARERKINDELQYPMNIAKTNATLVERSGNVVAFLLLGAPDDRPEADEAERAEYARQEVQKAADAFHSFFS